MTHSNDALVLPHTFDFHNQTVRWGQLVPKGRRW
ncbi:hypothetical protein PFLmoz3_02538 [Pseudomonas fluorescens]|uniref:Uncharacterized protein n=1 Tax=Pseudomonas fluorescens TaxID=294 RepID=A0A109LI28_PSEFL|nr:hypothetical protein PFLmoz3_02538 [Pseudomonas fluorescens]